MICSTCGNEIAPSMSICPYCDTPQEKSRALKEKKPVVRVQTVVLKDGNPTVQEALSRLDDELVSARRAKVRVVRLIHGYGSSGVGGAIRTAVLSRLKALKGQGIVKLYLTGEAHFEYGARQNPLLRKYPELQQDWIKDRGNRGITLVELA